MCKVKQDDLVDGKRYIITFNDGKDCVSSIWIKEFSLFSFSMGSISFNEVTKIE